MNKATAQRARLKSLGRQAHLVLAHGRPEVVVTTPGTVEDDLLGTAVCRALRERGQRGIWVTTDHPDLFRASPDVDGAVPRTDDAMSAARRCGASVLSLDPRAPSADEEHVLALLCRQAGLTGVVRPRPTVYLRPDDLEGASPEERRIAVCCAAPGERSSEATHAISAAAALLGHGFDLLQIGDVDGPVIPGARDCRGRLSPRQAAAALARCSALLGVAGLWMHLARAVECPAVIVHGAGDADPRTSYPCNAQVEVGARAAPDPVTVAAAVRRLAARPRQPLEVAAFELPGAAVPVAA